MNELTTITVTVPVSSLGALYGHIATHFDRGSDGGTPAVPSIIPAPSGDGKQLSEADIKEAYWGGSGNEPWRDLLKVLADHAGEEVYWPDLCDAVRQTRKVMSGVIGAGERRAKDKTPYTKRYSGDDTWFLMSPQVAKVIKGLAAEQH